jgi:hypothetical protein
VVLSDREEGGLDVIQKYVGAAKVTAIFTKRELDVLLAR